MKLGIAVPKEVDLRTFSLYVDGDTLVLQDENGWSVVGLKVVDNKIKLIRYSSIEDDAYETDSNGRVEETEE